MLPDVPRLSSSNSRRRGRRSCGRAAGARRTRLRRSAAALLTVPASGWRDRTARNQILPGVGPMEAGATLHGGETGLPRSGTRQRATEAEAPTPSPPKADPGHGGRQGPCQ